MWNNHLLCLQMWFCSSLVLVNLQSNVMNLAIPGWVSWPAGTWRSWWRDRGSKCASDWKILHFYIKLVQMHNLTKKSWLHYRSNLGIDPEEVTFWRDEMEYKQVLKTTSTKLLTEESWIVLTWLPLFKDDQKFRTKREKLINWKTWISFQSLKQPSTKVKIVQGFSESILFGWKMKEISSHRCLIGKQNRHLFHRHLCFWLGMWRICIPYFDIKFDKYDRNCFFCHESIKYC